MVGMPILLNAWKAAGNIVGDQFAANTSLITVIYGGKNNEGTWLG